MDTSRSASPAGLPMTSIPVILPFAIVKLDRSHQFSIRRHRDADRSIDERGLPQAREVRVAEP
jgi:hypothetical protein